MTDAPERIWIDWKPGMAVTNGPLASPPRQKYIRADLVPTWQPIETAPKDGIEILTIRSNGYIAKAVWYDNPFGRTDTVIENASGNWWSVTHWMPLPPAPENQGFERTGGAQEENQ